MWDRWFLFSFGFLPFWKGVSVTVTQHFVHYSTMGTDNAFPSQVHGWRGILPQDGSYPESQPYLTSMIQITWWDRWDFGLELMLQWLENGGLWGKVTAWCMGDIRESSGSLRAEMPIPWTRSQPRNHHFTISYYRWDSSFLENTSAESYSISSLVPDFFCSGSHFWELSVLPLWGVCSFLIAK